jgi:DNA-directed RNA polymerase subunit RPC12/RpoP
MNNFECINCKQEINDETVLPVCHECYSDLLVKYQVLHGKYIDLVNELSVVSERINKVLKDAEK